MIIRERSIEFFNRLKRRYAPSGKCVSPMRIPAWKREALYFIFKELGCMIGAEIGVREGLNAEAICKTVLGIHLLCIDPWAQWPGHVDMKRHEDNPQLFLGEAKARLIAHDCEFIQKTSQEAVRDIPDGSLDFVYIDGDHTFDYTMMDLITWSPKVQSGGIISGHDFKFYRLNGVIPAVMAYTQQHQIYNWYITGEKEASYFWVNP